VNVRVSFLRLLDDLVILLSSAADSGVIVGITSDGDAPVGAAIGPCATE